MNKDKLINILKNAAAVVVLLALLTIIFYQNRDRDLFGSKTQKDDASVDPSQKNAGVFKGYTGGDICTVGDNVALITTDTYSVLNVNGEGKISKITMPSPVMHGNGDYVIYYNKDDKEAFVCKRDRLYYSIKTENRIIRAKVSHDGYCMLVTEKEGYSSELLVYDTGGDATFKWDISKSEFLDADVDSDNSRLIVSQAAVQNGKLTGQLVLLDMSEAREVKKKSFNSELFYTVQFNRNGTYTALGSERLAYFNRGGTIKWSKKYDGRTLLKADITDPDMLVLAFSAVGSGVKGNSTEIELVDRLGKTTAKRTVNSLADDIRTNGSKIAAAFGKKVYVLDHGLKTEKTLESETGVKKTAFFGDGKHLFVLGNSGGAIMQ